LTEPHTSEALLDDELKLNVSNGIAEEGEGRVASDTQRRRTKGELMMSGLYSMGDRIAALIFGFGSLWMLTRLTTQANFGVWFFFTGLVATVEVARTGLIQNALIRYLSTEPASEHGSIYGGAWLLNGLLTLGGSALLFFSGDAFEAWFNFPGLAKLMDIYALTFLGMTPLYQFNYIQQAHLEFRGAFWATILRYSTMFLITAAMFFGVLAVDGASLQTLEYLAWGQLVAASLGALISYRFARPYIPAAIKFSRAWAGKLIAFGKYVFGTNLSSMMYKQVDSAMLGMLLLGPVPAAVYGLAIRITNFVDVPTLAVASIVFPESSRASAQEGSAAQARMYEKAVAAILAFVLPALIVVGLLPWLFVALVGGSKYAATIPVLQLTVLFSLFIPFANQFGTLLDASGNPRLNFVFTLSGMLVNVVLNYFYISRLGVIGAPLGTLSSYMIMFVAMQTLLHRRYGVRLGNVVRNLPSTYKMIWSFLRSKIPSRS